MLGSLLFMLAMAWALLIGCVNAGEENIMAMRGETPDGRAQVNQFQFRAGWDDVVATPAEAAGKRTDYLEWKDSCVRAPVLVAGQALELDAAGSFGLVRPYTQPQAQAEDAQDGFFDLLLQELSFEQAGPAP